MVGGRQNVGNWLRITAFDGLWWKVDAGLWSNDIDFYVASASVQILRTVLPHLPFLISFITLAFCFSTGLFTANCILVGRAASLEPNPMCAVNQESSACLHVIHPLGTCPESRCHSRRDRLRLHMLHANPVQDMLTCPGVHPWYSSWPDHMRIQGQLLLIAMEK